MERSGLRLIKLRYAGGCTRCGEAVAAGTHAWWDGVARAVTCTECRDFDGNIIGRDLGPIGAAGASIEREAERRHDRRRDQITNKHRKLGAAYLTFSSDPPTTQALKKGAIGEQKVARRLDELVNEGIAVLHNRRVPGHGGDIDHIVVAPSGVHIIDSKRYKGRVEKRNKGSFLRGQDIRLYVASRDKTNLVDKMAAQVLHVDAALRGIPQPTVTTPVLCFVDADWPDLLGRPLELNGVRIMRPKVLVKFLRRPGPLAPNEIVALRDRLAFSLPPA